MSAGEEAEIARPRADRRLWAAALSAVAALALAAAWALGSGPPAERAAEPVAAASVAPAAECDSCALRHQRLTRKRAVDAGE